MNEFFFVKNGLLKVRIFFGEKINTSTKIPTLSTKLGRTNKIARYWLIVSAIFKKMTECLRSGWFFVSPDHFRIFNLPFLTK